MRTFSELTKGEEPTATTGDSPPWQMQSLPNTQENEATQAAWKVTIHCCYRCKRNGHKPATWQTGRPQHSHPWYSPQSRLSTEWRARSIRSHTYRQACTETFLKRLQRTLWTVSDGQTCTGIKWHLIRFENNFNLQVSLFPCRRPTLPQGRNVWNGVIHRQYLKYVS